MHETAGLIPQAFYDLIGRIVPGAAMILASTVLLTGDSRIESFRALLWDLQEGSSLALLLAALLASYLVGALLGAFAFACNEDRVFRRHRSEHEDQPKPTDTRTPEASSSHQRQGERATLLDSILGGFRVWRTGDDALHDCLSRIAPTKPESTIDETADVIKDESLPYVYDFILMRDAAAGGRLAKLSAEMRMCRVLRLGALLLIVLYIVRISYLALMGIPLPNTFIFELIVTIVCLVTVAIGCYLLDVYLAIRRRRLMVNCWDLLK